MFQVGESHVDVQRTTTNNLTGTACAHSSPDQKCIGLSLLLILLISYYYSNFIKINNFPKLNNESRSNCENSIRSDKMVKSDKILINDRVIVFT